MRSSRIAVLVPMLGMLAFLHPQRAEAAGFECDWRTAVDEPAGANDITSILPIGDALDDPARLGDAIDKLRQQGLSKALIIDNLIGAYCPVVAGNQALNDPQKVAQMQRFAGSITRLVYQVEGETEIILNVPFPPTAVDQIQSKAAALNVTKESWIASTVETALEAKP